MTNNINREHLKEELRKDEGFENKTYPGPVTGEPHIGYGHLLGQEQTDDELEVMNLDDELDDWTDFEISVEQAEKLLDIDVDDAIHSLAPTWSEEELEALDPERYIALMSMAFQIGGFGIQRKFPSFVKAVKDKDYNRAAEEMLWSNGLKKQRRSAWWKQTKGRCEEMAEKMRNGTVAAASNQSPEQIDTPLTDATDQGLIAELSRRFGFEIAFIRKDE